ncbi:centrosomal protein of 295 kDa-like [Seriola lalandi dorsalis]|uniref:centrosomal protein of 295 kDa-like n=1 Tax=Seriola lalandi dorsalis TaxID=1841481 RepID=UPI000C6F9E2C|nr:centrosomal protein of 295 kDa-like [Seriola lalandi dorsalis]
MKRKVAKLRLSPNEEARIIREEHDRRRKLRIQQVREQQRYIALQIRQAVEQRRQRELEQLAEELRQDWERQQREKLDTLQRLYHESLQLLGQGHRSAKENEPDLAAIAQRQEENHTKAEERYREALKELKSQRLKDHERQSQFINARKKALQAEKERAAKVASLPPPPPNPIQNIDSRKPHVVRKSDVSAFAATHYHMSETAVDREVDTEQQNAHEEAELEVRRLKELQREEKRRREEQLEKARLRGKQALRKEQLEQDRERLLVELEHMQQTDLLRRRQLVSQMPAQIFQPLYKRQETREDFQREMEFAFEDMYTGERRVKGDLVVQLEPEPLPALSTGSQDQELDITQDENTQHDAEQEAASTEQETFAQVEPSRPAPKRALKKLLDRIRSQRNQWTGHNSRVPAADPPTVFTDQIPERDTTIETGSLTSEDKHKLPPIELPEPVHPPQPLEISEQSSAPDTRLPVLANRIQEFEEERKKREEELEKEKQQQVVLLQELEEQKDKLEQMLLEAQQEREHLKAAVTQEVPITQPHVPVHDREVTSVTPGQDTELEPPTGEDDHTRRIREYQQRLLEQNRIHQRSVEVARQRLDEYQRALRIRYSMTSTSFLPAVIPPGLSHPPLHSTQSVHLPPPLQLPTPAVQSYIHNRPQTSVEVPTRESDMLASPPHLPGSSFSSDSKLLQDEVESDLSSPKNQRPDKTAWLTDNIMERVTEHLPERVRPSSHSPESLPHNVFTTHQSATIPLHPTSDPIRAISPSITDDAPLVPVLAAVKPRTMSHGSLSSRGDDVERQRRELQEVQRQVLEKREAVVLQQKQQEEERQRQEDQRLRREEEMEQMRRQKETLQALIHTDTQPVPEAASEELVSEDIGQTRLRLLVSLLRAIEESNGGTLSHLEDPQQKDGSPQQLPSSSGETDLIAQTNAHAGPAPVSALPSEPPPVRAAKPPVTRVRLGITEMMTEQHELSAIQEVETPFNSSEITGPEDSMKVPSYTVDWDLQEESDLSDTSNRTSQTPSVSSSDQRTAERPTGSRTSSRRSSHLLWRERPLMGAESSESDSAMRIISPLSSDSGRGADYSGPAITSYRSYTESPPRPPDSDCLSSTTISTGSYITTDPEQNTGRGADLLDVFSPSGQSSCKKDSSAAGHPAVAVDSLFNDSSIQRIIDRYTRELNISLSTAGRTTDSEGSYLEEPGSSLSQQSLVQDSESKGEHEGSAGRRSLPPDTAGTQTSGLEGENTANQILEHFSGEDPSQAEDPEQDSFRPLIGQVANQSSCLAADQRDSAMEQLVGQPSAHSSMIGRLPGLPASVSMDQGGWDSTLSRMIGRLSHQSSSNWLSGGQDFYAGQLMGQMALEPSTTWLDDGQEESLMRPLVGELDNQHSGSSGESTHVDLGVSTEASLPSYPALPPEASSQSATVPGVSPHPENQILQNQTSLMDLGPERTEVFPGSDSFHPLLAEVTHNETADPSMTFHLLERNVPNSLEAQPGSGESSVSTPFEESKTHSDPSVESEPSPEHLRTEKPALHESSQCRLQESVLVLDDTMRTNVEPTALYLSNLSMCDDTAALGLQQSTGRDAEKPQDPVPFSDLCAEELKSVQGSNLRNDIPASDKILEVGSEKGILEESEITLVSLTDTTLQDQETSITEEEGIWEGKHPDGVREEGRTGQEMESTESTLIPEETLEDKDQTHPVMFLDFQWGPSRGLQEVNQQKRRALLQRSSRRVEDIKAKAALIKIQPEKQFPSEAREQSKTEESKPVTRKAKTKPEPQHKTNKSNRGQAEQQQTTEKSDFIKQQKPQLPPPVNDSKLKKVDEVRCYTQEQRKRDVSEMHQRTQRLYEQLEEVKNQKTIRSRQEAYAKNRLKAKEFHKKTLQKLRAKQIQQ